MGQWIALSREMSEENEGRFGHNFWGGLLLVVEMSEEHEGRFSHNFWVSGLLLVEKCLKSMKVDLVTIFESVDCS